MLKAKLILLLLISLPLPSNAFYLSGDDDSYLEVRGFLRGLAIASDNPNDDVLFTQDDIKTGGVFGRLIVDYRQSDLSFEFHAVQSYIEPRLRTGGSRISSGIGVDRSDGLQWRFADNHADFLIDRLNVNYATERVNVTVGRQPINLAATYYFTPNDFFAPFAAQTFFRTYKPGVDAARLDWQWNDNSQLSLFAVLDYPVDLTNTTGRDSSPDWSRTSYLARASSLFDVFQWGLLVGEVSGDDIIGFDVQGELFDSLGIRGEGHLRFPEHSRLERDTKIALAIDHRWPNSFTARIEHFYQRSGGDDSDDYSQLLLSETENYYLAQNYTAFGASYEISPLLFSDAVYLYNHQDNSKLLALYSTYSLSDESELALGLTVPIGDQPDNGIVKTEFGTSPLTLTAEYRLYF